MNKLPALLPFAFAAVTSAGAQSAADMVAAGKNCDFSNIHGAVWWGTETKMPIQRFVSYMAPILWFSSDEPSLRGARGARIRIPEALPQESKPDRPVLYYQLNIVFKRPGAPGAAVLRSTGGGANDSLDLTNTAFVLLKYFAYYPTEEGLGAHPHDIEPAEFRVVVLPHNWEGFKKWFPQGVTCAKPTFVIGVPRVSAQAHGLVWFWNVLNTDDDTQFPFHLLVEEGKHAFATDKNGDGVFTRGYDVNVRINDAWGARDIIRTGRMFSGGYDAWMTKVRQPQYRVLPPLPADSPLRDGLQREVEGVQNVTYELRPFPTLASAGEDHQLAHLMRDKVIADWPQEEGFSSRKRWRTQVDQGAVIKSLSISYRFDATNGVVWSFPFFGFKHLEDPIRGGYVLHRMYVQGDGLRDFGWMLLYTPSASRWRDTYLSAGAENAHASDSTGAVSGAWDFVFETGIKYRININETPLKVLHHLTDYWGVRLGLKTRGFPSVDRLGFVFEIGAGSF